METINRKRTLILILSVIGVLLLLLIGYIIYKNAAHAALGPGDSLIIKSTTKSYDNREPGSWKVEKTAEWVSDGIAKITIDIDTVPMYL